MDSKRELVKAGLQTGANSNSHPSNICSEQTDFDSCSNHLTIYKDSTLFYSDQTGHTLKRGLLGTATSLEIKTDHSTVGLISHVSCGEKYLFIGFKDGSVEMFEGKSFESVYSTDDNEDRGEITDIILIE